MWLCLRIFNEVNGDRCNCKSGQAPHYPWLDRPPQSGLFCVSVNATRSPFIPFFLSSSFRIATFSHFFLSGLPFLSRPLMMRLHSSCPIILERAHQSNVQREPQTNENLRACASTWPGLLMSQTHLRATPMLPRAPIYVCIYVRVSTKTEALLYENGGVPSRYRFVIPRNWRFELFVLAKIVVKKNVTTVMFIS